MNSADVIGYHYEGEAICLDCYDATAFDGDEMENHGGLIFAENESDFIGSTCSCGSCYGPDGWS